MSLLSQLIGDLLSRPRATSQPTAEDERGNPLIDYLEANVQGGLIDRWRHYFDIYHRHLASFRASL